MLGEARQCRRTAAPTVPVAPVNMICMVSKEILLQLKLHSLLYTYVWHKYSAHGAMSDAESRRPSFKSPLSVSTFLEWSVATWHLRVVLGVPTAIPCSSAHCRS